MTLRSPLRLGRYPLAFVAALAFGCMAPSMRKWVGHRGDELLATRGAPDSAMRMSDGGKVMTWQNMWRDPDGGIHTCRISFTTDSADTIRAWSYADCERFSSVSPPR
jgi:hypothetical protein